MLMLRAKACIRATAHIAHTLPSCMHVSPTAAGTASISANHNNVKVSDAVHDNRPIQAKSQASRLPQHIILLACTGLQASDSAALAGFQSLPASSSDQPEKENCSTAGEGDNQQAAPELPSNKRQKRTPKETKPPRPPKSQSEAAAGAQSPPDIAPPPEPTEYAKNRPRR